MCNFDIEIRRQHSQQTKIFKMALKMILTLWCAFESIFWLSWYCIALKFASDATSRDVLDFSDFIERSWYFWVIFGESAMDVVNHKIQSEWKKVQFSKMLIICNCSELGVQQLFSYASVFNLPCVQLISSRSDNPSK